MSFINRKITSRATFAVFLTATILASCSSDDSSSTGRLKNSIGADGQLCYYDEERASLLLGAVAIPERKKIEYQAAVEELPEVKYQAPKAATALVPAKPEVPEVLYQAAVSYQPAVPYRAAGWYSALGVQANNPSDYGQYATMTSPTSFTFNFSFPIYYSLLPEQKEQPEVKARAEVKAQAKIPAQAEIPAGDEIPEVLASDEVLAQDAQPGKTLEEVKDEINSVKKCADDTVIDTNDNGGDSAGGDSSGDDSSGGDSVAPVAAPSGPATPVCISGADKDGALAGYDEQLKAHEKDADLKWYNELLNGRNNVAGREICTGTEVSKVVIVAIQTKVDQPFEQASVPAAVLTVEKPVVLINEPVKEVVVEPIEVQELVTSAGFVEGTVEVQVENAEGFSDWLMIDPASSNTVALGEGAKTINYRVTSKDKSQPVVEKTVEIKRLSVATAVKVAVSNQSAVTPTVEDDSSSTSKQTMYLVGFGAVLLILLLIFFTRKKKKVDENASKVA